jgi:hypothetical protein
MERTRNSYEDPKPASSADPELPNTNMEIEISFVGLCTFLNLRRKNLTMGDPAVILVRTPANEAHIPFIAFDSRDLQVEVFKSEENQEVPEVDEPVRYCATPSRNRSSSPPQSNPLPPGFNCVPNAEEYLYRLLDGANVSLRHERVGWPEVTPSYSFVSSKDRYWPQVKNRWDRRFVPRSGQLPDFEVVAAYMRFGGGTISAERMTDIEWEFRDRNNEPTHRGYFAREVLYRIYPFHYGHLDVRLRHPKHKERNRTLRFSPLVKNGLERFKIKIWIGNSDRKYIDEDILRISTPPAKGAHFKHSNQVAGTGDAGPLPVPIIVPGTFTPKDGDSGGNTGYCGPTNGDG